MYILSARSPKTNSPWCHDSNSPSRVINGPNLAELLKIDFAKNSVFSAEFIFAKIEHFRVSICFISSSLVELSCSFF